MRVVFQMSAIVAALALAGCGQRGALYLPTVPPLPPKPIEHTAPASNVKPDGNVPDTTGTPLTLSPELSTPGTPRATSAADGSAAPPAPASDATPDQ